MTKKSGTFRTSHHTWIEKHVDLRGFRFNKVLQNLTLIIYFKDSLQIMIKNIHIKYRKAVLNMF